jgi:large subunit ribosomal protein L25
MEQIELAVSKRSTVGKQVKGLRRDGIVPAVLYGRHLGAPVLLQMEARVFSRVLARAGTSHLVTLNIAGESSPQLTLVREVQREPITGSFYHVDFLAVSMTEKIRLKVPVVITGEAPPVARNEGIVLQAMDEIEIECLPGDLIESVRVDISALDQVGKEIKVGDLGAQLKGVEILAEPDELVVRITAMREEKIEEALPAEGAEVEVITKGKIEEEGEEKESEG